MFTQTASYKRLKSQKPVGLTLELTPERIRKMVLKGVGFDLLYATERVSFDILDDLYALADETHVLEKMRQMQSGETLNRIFGYESENRAVLHTAMRDQFSDRQTAAPAVSAREKASAELQKLEHFLEKHEEKFTDLIQIGIGGSDLGPRALCVALQAFQRPNHRVHFISNVDTDDANGVLNILDLKKTLIVVVSKSGVTLETLTNEEFVREKFRKMGLNPKNHFVAVTAEKSPMDDASRYLASFFVQLPKQWIGR